MLKKSQKISKISKHLEESQKISKHEKICKKCTKKKFTGPWYRYDCCSQVSSQSLLSLLITLLLPCRWSMQWTGHRRRLVWRLRCLAGWRRQWCRRCLAVPWCRKCMVAVSRCSWLYCTHECLHCLEHKTCVSHSAAVKLLETADRPLDNIRKFRNRNNSTTTPD